LLHSSTNLKGHLSCIADPCWDYVTIQILSLLNLASVTHQRCCSLRCSEYLPVNFLLTNICPRFSFPGR
jgi:hypothetical protein